MISLIVGKPRALRYALARALILPCVLCGTLASILGGAVLLGAELPDGTIHITTQP